MTPDGHHLRLVLDDDLRLEPVSAGDSAAWRAALGEEVRRGAAPRVLLAAHGGLVPRAAGEAFAGHVRELDPGGWTVTFITRTGLIESLDRLTNTRLFSGLAWVVGQLAALSHRATPGAFFPEGPVPWEAAFLPESGARMREDRLLARLRTLALDGDAGESPEARALAEHWRTRPGELETAVREAARQANARLGTRTWQLVQPALAGRSSLTVPEVRAALASAAAAAADPGARQAELIEELIRTVFPPPRFLWEEMKDRMAALLAPGAVGTDLLDFLNGLPPLRVSLLGHSLGGILLDHLQRRAAVLSPLRERVAGAVYLAPANTLAFTRATPRLPHAAHALMGLTDAEERDEVGQTGALLGGLYPRTLLYLISNALEDERETPLLGMQRFLPADPLRRRFHTVTWVPTTRIPQFTHGGFLRTKEVRDWVRARLDGG